jgi:hypothetical protein
MLFNPWVRASFAAWSIGLEASSVIALRMLKMSRGGATADKEAWRMVSEKIESCFALQAMATREGGPLTAQGAVNKILAHYRRKVRANRRRLS